MLAPTVHRLLALSLAATAALCAPAAGLALPSDEIPAEVLAARESLTVAGVRATEYFLASDFLAGRDTPSPQLEIAAAYIESRFRAAGLEPLDPERGYRHRVSLPGSLAPQQSPDSALFVLGREIDLQRVRAIVPHGATPTPREVDAELMWIGAPQALLVADRSSSQGRVGLVVEGVPIPESLPEVPATFRNGMSPALISRLAGRSGFAALVVVCDPSADTFEAAREGLGRVSLRTRGRSSSTPVVLVADAPLHAELTRAANEEDSALREPHVMEEGSFVGLLPGSTEATVEVDNVAGILPGSDPARRAEYVLISAHYDHVGTNPSAGEDPIFNGADDNATGTTGVIHLAEAFAALPRRPARSLVFVAFCGEEKGLLGSRAWAADPPLPLEDTVANVNLEMIGRPDDIGPNRAWVTGFQYSDLGPILAAAAEQSGVTMDRHLEMGDRLFGASDNYSLAEKGVVAHTISAGSLHSDYHQPSDEVGKIDFENMTRVLRAAFLGIWSVADRSGRPAWNEQAPSAVRRDR